MLNNFPKARFGSQASPKVSLRAVILSLLITIPNAYWLMINWGPSGYSTGQSFPTVSTVYFNVIFIVLILMALNPLLRSIRKSSSFTDAELMVVYLLVSIALLHRRTRHTSDIVAPAYLSDLVCEVQKTNGANCSTATCRIGSPSKSGVR